MFSFTSFGRNTSKLKGLLGIQARLALLALILVIPLMLDRVRLLEDTRAKQAAQATNDLSELAKHTAAAQREIISTVQAVLKSSAYIYAAAAPQDRSCAVMRASLRVDLSWIRAVSIIGGDGKIQCSTMPNIVGLDLSDREYFKQAHEFHDFVLSDYVFSRAANLPTIIAAFPVSAIGSREEAVIIAAVDLKWMSQLLSNRGGRTGMSVAMIDGNGTILATRPEDIDTIGQPLADTALMGAVAQREIYLERESGSISFVSDTGEKKAVSFARVSGTRARMLVSVNEFVMLGAIDRDIRAAYIQLAVIGFLALVGAWIVGQRLIIRPMRVVVNVANRFGEGDLTARVTSTGLPREFRPLVQAFNNMASQLAGRERELLSANDQLAVIASIDPVSGLANRRGFQSRFDFEWMKALQTETSLALMMIDVDYFKLFNDTYGHPEGDACLARLGATLSEISSKNNGFATRYGGEEFCLLLPDTDSPKALKIAEKVRMTVEGLTIPHKLSGSGIVTVSIGIAAVAPSKMQIDEDLIEAADTALYAAKRRGRNTVVEHALIRTADTGSLIG